jgi:ubiquinone/menaquinone biosynthesis C-methylase UbiE
MTDYDQTDIPRAYDRARDHGPAVIDLWMRTVANHVNQQSITRILDLGCGTGRFSEGLAVRFHAEVMALDPSRKMVQIAREKQRNPHVRYTLGRAEAIPLGSESVDLIFISMALHHFADLGVAASECRRVLRESGRVVIRTGTSEQIPSYPYVSFFPASLPLLEETLPSHTDLRAMFAMANLHVVASELVTQTIAVDWTAYVEKLAAGGDSILARLNRQDFDAGLAAVRRYADTEAQRPVVEPIDFFVLA